MPEELLLEDKAREQNNQCTEIKALKLKKNKMSRSVHFFLQNPFVLRCVIEPACDFYKLRSNGLCTPGKDCSLGSENASDSLPR